MTATILLQSSGGGMAMQQLLMLGLIVLIMYFFMLRPQMRKVKIEKQFKESINKGDKIVTIGGIHGKIIEIAETTFLIEIDNNVKIRIEKSAVSAEASKQFQKPADKK
ncbi:MAG TPA: preprotein translocase subunit YajC [Bacteroidia bacterium]|nr:MAG: preprotein translocase subunit YajC [Bacteroidetes bacterium OLB10]MBE7511054.1 preprotein translocase subunit YajC [Bacteroidia bacterium]MBX3105632.1 preprotein translocase subunit YajC [Bacteroidota bacterium]MCE7954811.1 preprotein translocase subunit YajC [Bacteroidetes bacterium CHB6]OQB62478.1 MAG: preprotein translocase subunit YajC [Bacteroidetes bacterium ADurb.Bin141]